MSGGHVKLESLTKQFGDVTAVDEISVEIQAGEFFSLLGPSGCGKTSTLRMIAEARPKTRMLYLAFNKAIQVEMVRSRRM